MPLVEAALSLLTLVQDSPDLSLGTILDWISKAGLLGAVTTFAWLLMTDKLYTKGRHEDVVALLKERITTLEDENKTLRKDRDDWKDVGQDRVQALENAVEVARAGLRRRRTDTP